MPSRPRPFPARVRMYRQGLGDCFLVTLPRADGGPFRLLIDCGVLAGTPDAEATMTRVARDIAATTGGHLDVVVVSHEHWDHVSGFLQARGVFAGMTIDEVWLPWTEDPACTLREERRRAMRGLRVVAGRLAGPDAPAAGRLRGLLGLFGAASGPDTREAIDSLANHPSRPRVRYLGPDGPPLALPGLDGTSVYILGPPRKPAASRPGDPTPAGHDASGLTAGVPLFAAAGLSLWEGGQAELNHAFEARYRLPAGTAEGLPFFRAHYLRPDDQWRRIDAHWLGAAEPLALALDGETNNTSLVLAFELEPGGRVLLFPGDAQAGSWQSWGRLRWPRGQSGTRRVSAADLLARTVLYKVGHHGSDNATPREQGLGLLTSPELVALVPVSRAMAERMGWNMPFPPLLEQLRRKTRGRVLLADAVMPDPPADVPAGEWDAFARNVEVDPGGLFLEYTIP